MKDPKDREVCQCDVIHRDIVSEVEMKSPPPEKHVKLASLFKMFADPSRVRLLHALSIREMCVCDLAAFLGISKSAVSHQLKPLRIANLVRYRRDGQIVYYSLADDHVQILISIGLMHMEETEKA